MSTTLDLAAYLVGQGAGLASPVITRAIRLATPHGGMARLRRAALPFRQHFHCDCVSLVELVAFLTDPGVGGQRQPTLGERLTHLTTSQDSATVQLREGLRLCRAATTTRKHNHSFNSGVTEVASIGGGAGAHIFASVDSAATAGAAFVDPIHSILRGGMEVVSSDEDHHHHHHDAEDLEDLLYQMVVWLCSHEVLVQLQDYLMAKFPLTNNVDRSDRQQHPAGEHKSDATNVRLDLGSDDWIWQELLDAECLSGRISVPACCWKTGLDPVKVYQLVSRHPQQLRLVTRLPVRGDDWEEL